MKKNDTKSNENSELYKINSINKEITLKIERDSNAPSALWNVSVLKYKMMTSELIDAMKNFEKMIYDNGLYVIDNKDKELENTPIKLTIEFDKRTSLWSVWALKYVVHSDELLDIIKQNKVLNKIFQKDKKWMGILKDYAKIEKEGRLIYDTL